MTTFQQSDWTAAIVAAGTSGTIRKSPDPSSPCEGAGPPDYAYTMLYACAHGVSCDYYTDGMHRHREG